MTTDYRALCAELVDSLHKHTSMWEGHESELVARARALLAQPVAEGPTDEELDVIERQCWIPTDVCNDAGCEYLLDHRRFARAALARWGRPTPQPVAVSERLPKPEDCDELETCWQWEPDINGHHPLGLWERVHRDWVSDPDSDTTHWLPANALPTPEATND